MAARLIRRSAPSAGGSRRRQPALWAPGLGPTSSSSGVSARARARQGDRSDVGWRTRSRGRGGSGDGEGMDASVDRGGNVVRVLQHDVRAGDRELRGWEASESLGGDARSDHVHNYGRVDGVDGEEDDRVRRWMVGLEGGVGRDGLSAGLSSVLRGGGGAAHWASSGDTEEEDLATVQQLLRRRLHGDRWVVWKRCGGPVGLPVSLSILCLYLYPSP